MTKNTTDKHNPLVSVQEFPDNGKLQIIHGYGNGQFRIAGQSYNGAQFIFPRLTLGWQINGLADIRAEQIAAMLEQGRDAGIDKTQHSQKTELVLLGVGARADSHLPHLAKALKEHNPPRSNDHGCGLSCLECIAYRRAVSCGWVVADRLKSR